MKKYLQFNIDNTCSGVFDNPGEGLYEFEFEENKFFLPTLKLENNVVVHTMPGLSYSEQEIKYNSDKEKSDLEQLKLDLIPMIKLEAGRQIQELDWKLERAKEQDMLAGTSTKTQEILNLRQQIRQASNDHEARALAIKSREELDAFDARDF